MKRFLANLALFLLPVCLILYPADRYLSSRLKHVRGYVADEYITWNAIINGQVNADILIYGSSRASSHFDPTILAAKLHKRCYNLGINGHNFWMQYLRHQLLLEHNTPPKTIILSLDAYSLIRNRYLVNPEQFLPYMLGNQTMARAVAPFSDFRPIDSKVPLIRYYGRSTALNYATGLFNEPVPTPIYGIDGYQPRDLPWTSDFQNARKDTRFLLEVPDPATVMLFSKFLQECKNRHISVILVYTPEYFEGQRFVGNRTNIMRIFQTFSSRYQIPFYDYSNDPISFNRNYFYNTQHLNRKGAELFSRKFADTLLKQEAVAQ